MVAKVEWHPGELYPRVGFIVTNLSRPAERVVAFYNQRGKAEQYIKEGKNAIRWTRLSCLKFRNNAVRLQLHALAYNLANFMRAHPCLRRNTEQRDVRPGARHGRPGRVSCPVGGLGHAGPRSRRGPPRAVVRHGAGLVDLG